MTFVDTNVLVYATAIGGPFRERAGSALEGASSGSVSVRRQVLREYVSVVTRLQAWGQPLTLSTAFADTELFLPRFILLEDGPPVWEELVVLGKLYLFGGRQVHDANIVATMLAYDEHRLLTFNEVDFRRFKPLIEIVVP